MTRLAIIIAMSASVFVGACGGSDPTPATNTGVVKTAPAQPTLTVDGLDPAACQAYADKQARLNPGKTWTARVNGTVCEVTAH